MVEAKQKRIAELSVGTVPLENGRKSHWDFVLEEMAWLVNDFAQERLSKTASAQICRRVAFTWRLKFGEQNQYRKLKRIALTLANSVMDFWHSAEVLLNSKNASLGPKPVAVTLRGQGPMNLLRSRLQNLIWVQRRGSSTLERKMLLDI